MNRKNLEPNSKTNWKRIDAMKDDEIDYSDIPELTDDFFKKAVLKLPTHKTPVTIRVDDEVLEWFKGTGKGYQTRINSLLRQYMEIHKH